MYKKLCPNCHKSSFSSIDSGKWICPTCNSDLTKVSLRDAETQRQTKPQLFLIHNCDSQLTKTFQSKVSLNIFKSYD